MGERLAMGVLTRPDEVAYGWHLKVEMEGRGYRPASQMTRKCFRKA
jgi:hypothetical protein